MPFEAFMEACLYDRDDGFFAAGPLRSVKAGDFLTSPEVSPWFGRTLGRFVSSERVRMGDGGRRPFFVADVGAGSGSLLASLTDHLGDGLDIWAADASPAARASLATHDGWNIVAGLDGLRTGVSGVIFANELLDNLPAALVVRTDEAWQERWVGVNAEGLLLVDAPARAEVAAWADRYSGRVADGGMVEVQLAAGVWLREALRLVDSGSVVVIDYGGTAEELEPRRTTGTLRTYRAHHLGPDPLLEPGATDVTVDVNFTALVAVAEDSGAEVELHRQDDFLTEWGLRDEVKRMRREELDLARGNDAIARLRARSERTEADTLLHPRGLGDFRVLVARKS